MPEPPTLGDAELSSQWFLLGATRLFTNYARKVLGGGILVPSLLEIDGGGDPVPAMIGAARDLLPQSVDPVVLIEAVLFGSPETPNRFGGLRAFRRAVVETLNLGDPIIILATTQQERDFIPAIEAGANVVVSDPGFDSEALQVTVRALGRERARLRQEKKAQLEALDAKWEEEVSRNRRFEVMKLFLAGAIALASGIGVGVVVHEYTTKPAPTWSATPSYERLDSRNVQGYIALDAFDAERTKIVVRVVALPPADLVRITNLTRGAPIPVRTSDRTDGYPFQIAVVGGPDDLEEHWEDLVIQLRGPGAASSKEYRSVALPKKMLLQMAQQLHRQKPLPPASVGKVP